MVLADQSSQKSLKESQNGPKPTPRSREAGLQWAEMFPRWPQTGAIQVKMLGRWPNIAAECTQKGSRRERCDFQQVFEGCRRPSWGDVARAAGIGGGGSPGLGRFCGICFWAHGEGTGEGWNQETHKPHTPSRPQGVGGFTQSKI